MHCLIGSNLIKQRTCSYGKINRATIYSNCYGSISEKHINNYRQLLCNIFSRNTDENHQVTRIIWPAIPAFLGKVWACVSFTTAEDASCTTQLNGDKWKFAWSVYSRATSECMKRVALFREGLKHVSQRKCCYMKSLPLHQNTSLDKKNIWLWSQSKYI